MGESSREKYILKPEGHSRARSLTSNASCDLSGDGRDASVVTRTTKGGSFHLVVVLSLRSMSVYPSLQNIGGGSSTFQNSNDVAEQGHVPLAKLTRRLIPYDVSLKPIVANRVAPA